MIIIQAWVVLTWQTSYRGGQTTAREHMRPLVSFCAARTRLCTAVFNLCDLVPYRIEFF